MKSTTLRLLLTVGMMSAAAMAMSPAEVNAQTTTRVCVRSIGWWCLEWKDVPIRQQPTPPPQQLKIQSSPTRR